MDGNVVDEIHNRQNINLKINTGNMFGLKRLTYSNFFELIHFFGVRNGL